MRLGILGGTFDPIHVAHLFLAEEARARYALDRVLFIPNAVPPHKARRVSHPAHRFAMVQLAVAANRAFEGADIEIARPGRSYTVDTLHALQRQYPAAGLFFLTGTDALAEIQTWRRPEEVASLCTFVVAERPGCTLAEVESLLPARYRERMLPLDTPHLAVSSTDIRRRVREGRPIRYLVPDPVADYITEHRLYRE